MAKAKKNMYQQAATKKATIARLSSRLNTKDKIIHAGKETGKDILVGVIGGGLLAALIGKWSFFVGLGATGAGHYADNPLLTSLGLGMMASGSTTAMNGTNGFDGLDGAKERVAAFKQSMMERTFLDKVMKKGETVNGTVGELQYFDYNQMSGASDNPELYGMGALNEIEQQIAEAGMARLQGTEGIGNIGALSPELEGGMGYADVSDYNF